MITVDTLIKMLTLYVICSSLLQNFISNIYNLTGLILC